MVNILLRRNTGSKDLSCYSSCSRIVGLNFRAFCLSSSLLFGLLLVIPSRSSRIFMMNY